MPVPSSHRPHGTAGSIGRKTSPTKSSRGPNPTPDAVTQQHVRRLQNVVSSFQYTCNGATYNVDKSRPLVAIMQTGRSIRYGRRPIQCVEAVFMALGMSHGFLDIERFGLSFRAAEPSGKVNRHLVLGIYASGKFAAIGISREPGLMNKALDFPSLADLVWDYKVAIPPPIRLSVAPSFHVVAGFESYWGRLGLLWALSGVFPFRAHCWRRASSRLL